MLENVSISVIVPVYKTEQYLDQCIGSILSQSFKDFELLLIDNGSSKKSKQIMASYTVDKRVKIITLETNIGLPAARNVGMKAKTGRYFTFVDSDDVCSCNMLKTMYDSAILYDSDVVVCNVMRFEDEIQKGVYHHPDWWYDECNRNISVEDCPELFMEQAAWAKLIRTDYADKIDYFFTEGSLCCEDVPACTTLLLSTKKISMVNLPLYCYRYRSSSLSNNTTRKHIDDYIFGMQKQNKIIEMHQFQDKNCWRVIIELRMLLARHILIHLKRNDVDYFFDKMGAVISEEDEQMLQYFFDTILYSRNIFDDIIKGKSTKNEYC